MLLLCPSPLPLPPAPPHLVQAPCRLPLAPAPPHLVQVYKQLLLLLVVQRVGVADIAQRLLALESGEHNLVLAAGMGLQGSRHGQVKSKRKQEKGHFRHIHMGKQEKGQELGKHSGASGCHQLLKISVADQGCTQ